MTDSMDHFKRGSQSREKTVTGCFKASKHSSKDIGPIQFYVNLHTFPYYRRTESFHYGFNITVNRDVVRANPFSLTKHQEKLRCKSGLLIISILLTLTMQVHFWQRCTLKGGKFTD